MELANRRPPGCDNGEIDNAWNNVVDEANEWADAKDNPLTDAYNDLFNAIDALPGDNTIAEDLSALQPQLDAFPQAFRQTFDGSGCSSV